MKIAVWADMTWCESTDVEEYTTFMSDDYMEIDVPETVEDIDEFLMETRPQG